MSKGCCNDAPVEKIPFVLKTVDTGLYYKLGDQKGIVPLAGIGSGASTLIPVPITNNQTVFSNILPVGKTVKRLFINGLASESEEYIVVERTVTWIGSYTLESTDKMIIETWQ